MAFNYYGGKKSLARHYSPPEYDTIIEPFAGGAGYATHYATPDMRVILIEKNANVAKIWRTLQTHLLDDPYIPNVGECIYDPLCGKREDARPIPFASVIFKGEQSQALLAGKARSTTTRVAAEWSRNTRILAERTLRIQRFEICEGDYTDAPDIEATWFIDPPYYTTTKQSGARYNNNHMGIDYIALGDWCRTRRGQTIVCEQFGATWLPFEPFRTMHADTRGERKRTEVVWQNTPQNLFTN